MNRGSSSIPLARTLNSALRRCAVLRLTPTFFLCPEVPVSSVFSAIFRSCSLGSFHSTHRGGLTYSLLRKFDVSGLLQAEAADTSRMNGNRRLKSSEAHVPFMIYKDYILVRGFHPGVSRLSGLSGWRLRTPAARDRFSSALQVYDGRLSGDQLRAGITFAWA